MNTLLWVKVNWPWPKGSTNLPVALFEMLHKFHQVCRVCDDLEVEFFISKSCEESKTPDRY